MPIARVMNNPDGSTPVPPIGGGDVNGTLATSILGAQAGGPMNAISLERHQHFQSSALGLVSPQAPMAAEGMGQAVALEDEGEDSAVIGKDEDAGTSEPAGEPGGDIEPAAVEPTDAARDVPRQSRRHPRHKP